MNTTTQTGNLTRDPEMKFLNGGQASCRFSIAVNRRWQNKQTNEWEERTSFFDIQAYGTLAENVGNSLRSGTRVTVTGRLEQRSWETDKGEKRSVVEIVADDVAASLAYATVDVAKTPRPSTPGRSPMASTEDYAF